MTPSHANQDPAEIAVPKPRRRSLPWVRLAILVVVIGLSGWSAWLYSQISYFAETDEAQRADAIAVFGAAEYDGRPSPVLRARLDHALDLYGHKPAPLVRTPGGRGG